MYVEVPIKNELGDVIGSLRQRVKLQCKHIPDELFIGAVIATKSSGGGYGPYEWRMRWNVQETLEKILGWEIPDKLFLVKAKKLMASKKLAGCDCGCRGDYHIPCDREGCCVLLDWQVMDEGEN